jgi:hypothetical protein
MPILLVSLASSRSRSCSMACATSMAFAMTAQRIVSEYLLVYKASKPQRWFTRYFDTDTDKDVYDFGSGLKGSKKGSKSLWEGATRPNSLFLSMAVQLNSDTLRPVFDWFANRVGHLQRASQTQSYRCQSRCSNRVMAARRFATSSPAADISIADIDVEIRKVPGQAVHFDLAAGKTEVRLGRNGRTQIALPPRHRTRQSRV